MDNKNRDEKLDFWRLVVEEFENSEKSIKEQCEANDIALGQYYNWRRKVRESEQEESTGFLELDSSEVDENKVDEVGISLEYGKDFRIILSEGFNLSIFKSVIKALNSL